MRTEQGVEAYKNARYEDALKHFRKAVQLDPDLVNAHLYLATTYADEFVPGVATPENTRNGDNAVAEFQAVLNNPSAGEHDKFTATTAIASLYFQAKKFEDAKAYSRKAIELHLNEPESYYTIAVIDWTQSYSARMEAYAQAHIDPVEGRLDSVTCRQVASEHLQQVEEAMQMLTKAIELRPDYDDAMAYMNLIYRERADYRCDDEEARQADLREADKWVDQTLAVKKAKMERQQASHPTHP